MVNFEMQSARLRTGLFWLVPIWGCLILGPLHCVLGCLAESNARDDAEARRLVLCGAELIYRTTKHKSFCRCDCTDVPESSTIIPLKNITDIKVIQPAGGCCGVQNVLSSVYIQTAGSSGIEMLLTGLVDAEYARRAIYAQMKGEALPKPPSDRVATLHEGQSSSTTKKRSKDSDNDDNIDEVAPRKTTKSRSTAASATASDAQIETVALLKEIREDLAELRAHFVNKE